MMFTRIVFNLGLTGPHNEVAICTSHMFSFESCFTEKINHFLKKAFTLSCALAGVIAAK